MKNDAQIFVEDGISIVVLEQEYDNLDTPAIEAAAKQLLDLALVADPPLLVVDMQHTKFFGSAFLGVLFRMWRRLESRGGRMVTCNAKGICAQVLDVTQVDKLWTVCSSREGALQVLKSNSAKSNS